MRSMASFMVAVEDSLRAQFMDNYIINMPTPFAVGAMIAAYDESEEWLDQLNAYLDEGLSNSTKAAAMRSMASFMVALEQVKQIRR